MHKAELDIIDAFVKAIAELSEQEAHKNHLEREGIRKFAIGLMENIMTCPPEPIACSPGLSQLIMGAPTEVWLDMIMALCTDTNMVLVSRSDLTSLVGSLDDEHKASLFGTVEMMEHHLGHQDHYNQELEKARNEGTHW